MTPEYYRDPDGKMVETSRSRRRRNWAGSALHEARRRARDRGYEFTLTVQDIAVPTQCPVLGIPIAVSDGRPGPNSPSLDRVDSTKGYTPDNVRVISWRANKIKGDATPEELERVAAYARGLV